MVGKRAISSTQLYCILFASRLMITLTFIPAFSEGLLPTDQIFEMLLWDVGMILSALPVYFLLKKRTGANVLDCAQLVSPVLSRCLAFGYSIMFLYGAISSIARFELFSTSVMYPEANSVFFIILFVAACAYIAILGLESLGRAALIMVTFVVGAFLFIFLTLIKRLDFLNFTPPFFEGPAATLQTTAFSLSRTIELGAIAIVTPRTDAKMVRGFFKWLISISTLMVLIALFTAGSLGGYAFTQLFPVYALASMAEFSVLQRLDALLTGIWILCALIRVGFFLCMIATCLEQGFQKKYRKTYVAGASLVVIAVCVFVSFDINRFAWVANGTVYLVLFGGLILVTPVVLSLLLKWKKKKKEKEALAA